MVTTFGHGEPVYIRNLFCGQVGGRVLVEITDGVWRGDFRIVEAAFEAVRQAVCAIGLSGLTSLTNRDNDDAEIARRVKLMGCRSLSEYDRVAKTSYASFRLLPEVECNTPGLSCGPDDFDAIAEFLWDGLRASAKPGRVIALPKVTGDIDRGLAFGPGEVWFAVRSDDSKLVAKKFGVKRTEKVSWAGLADEELRRSGVLVTAPLDGWVLVLVTGFHEDLETAPDLLGDDPDWTSEVVRSLSKRLKTDVQLFGWDFTFPTAAWARGGKIVALEEFLDLDAADAERTVARRAAELSVDPLTLGSFEHLPASLFGFEFDPPWN
jgi:hypothetical protein